MSSTALAILTVVYLFVGLMYLQMVILDTAIKDGKKRLKKPVSLALVLAIFIMLIWPLFVIGDLYLYFKERKRYREGTRKYAAWIDEEEKNT